MITEKRIEVMRERLVNAFSPAFLEIQDDSEKHKGHLGSQGGAGHYKIIILAECFNNQSLVESHKAVYAVLNDMIPHEIHALQINIKK